MYRVYALPTLLHACALSLCSIIGCGSTIPGKPCAIHSDCSDDVFCNGGETCVEGICRIGAAPCDVEHCDEDNDLCRACLEDTECADDKLCTTDSCIDYTCVFTPIECSENQECDSDSGECAAPQPLPSDEDVFICDLEENVFVGDIAFLDGTRGEDCQITDFKPGFFGPSKTATVGFSRTLEEAANLDTARLRTLRYAQIRRIDVLPLSSAEEQLVHEMGPYYEDQLIKCDVTFHDGKQEKAIFLLPHRLKYECEYETGSIRRAIVESIVFQDLC